MSKLSWIDDEKLNDAVSNMLARAQRAKDNAPTRMENNIVDPFSSLVLAAIVAGNHLEMLTTIQAINSVSSGISNAVGNFHQEILGAVQGFSNHDAGYDLECQDRHNSCRGQEQAQHNERIQPHQSS